MKLKHPIPLAAAATAGVTLVVALAIADPAVRALQNGSFEDGPAPPVGWEIAEGANNGASGQKSEVAIDKDTVKDGKASLRLAGGAGTTSWQLLRQKLPVAPGERVTLRAMAKSSNVRREGTQFENAHAMLEFHDAAVERVSMTWSPSLTGDHDWTEIRLTTLAPPRAATASADLFLSQSGTLWFDDVHLDIAPATLTDDAGRAAALDALEGHLRATYPFFGVARRPTADQFFAAARAKITTAKDEASFVAAMRAALGDLEDLHVWFTHGGKSIGTATPRALRRNFDAAARKALLTDVLDDQAPLVTGRIGTGDAAVGYIEVATFRMDDETQARLWKNLEKLSDCKALIIDVRENTGGDETLAQRLAARFCEADVVYAQSRNRDPWKAADSTAFLPPQSRTLSPVKDQSPDRRKVAVLQGVVSMSSCEGFLLMCRVLPSVTTVGARSRGASGNPLKFAITSDVVLMSSTWQATAPDGTAVEGKGVEPEVEVTALPTKVADPVIAKALELLAK